MQNSFHLLFLLALALLVHYLLTLLKKRKTLTRYVHADAAAWETLQVSGRVISVEGSSFPDCDGLLQKVSD